MLQTETTNLSEYQQKLLHPEFLANEKAYLRMREGLLPQYGGQWVAVEGGKVIVAGPRLLDVMERASKAGSHPYFALVGAEDAFVFRVRRAAFLYDQQYQPFPLPRLTAVFWNQSKSHSSHHANVIPGTGDERVGG